MSGPDLQYHMMPNADAEAKPLHTPAMVPLHWQEEVKCQLDEDVVLGVLEKVPYGEPSI